MELLIPVIALVALAVLALLFGSDTREGAVSAEERFARLGFSWGGPRPAAGRGLRSHPPADAPRGRPEGRVGEAA